MTPSEHLPDLADCTATELLQLYKSGQASPVEATRTVLARIDRLNPQLKAFCLVAHESAMQAAQDSEARWQRFRQTGEPCGELDGVPVSIKDLILTQGMPTLRGSHTVDANQPWDVDAPASARLREAGAVILGKTNTPEFGCKGETNSCAAASRATLGCEQNPRWLIRRRRSGGGRRAGAAGYRHRRRWLGAHPGGVLWQLRIQAQLWPRAGLPAVAVWFGRAPGAAQPQRA